MLEDRQKKIIIIALIFGGIILIAVFLLWLLLKPKEIPINTTELATSTVQTGETIIEPTILESANQPRLDNEKKYPLGSKQVAMTFAERYSSYSTHEPIKNIQDLESLTTSDFYSIIMSEAQARENPIAFYGYSAKALSVNLIDFNQSNVNVEVGLQIEQIIADGEVGNILYRTLKVALIKVGEEWKVKKASWQ